MCHNLWLVRQWQLVLPDYVCPRVGCGMGGGAPGQVFDRQVLSWRPSRSPHVRLGAALACDGVWVTGVGTGGGRRAPHCASVCLHEVPLALPPLCAVERSCPLRHGVLRVARSKHPKQQCVWCRGEAGPAALEGNGVVKMQAPLARCEHGVLVDRMLASMLDCAPRPAPPYPSHTHCPRSPGVRLVCFDFGQSPSSASPSLCLSVPPSLFFCTPSLPLHCLFPSSLSSTAAATS